METVQRGANLLDREGPTGWYNMVDLGSLDMSSVRNCVLGQVYGTYTDGLAFVGLTTLTTDHTKRGAYYGFERNKTDDMVEALSYFDLKMAWEGEILERRLADAGETVDLEEGVLTLA